MLYFIFVILMSVSTLFLLMLAVGVFSKDTQYIARSLEIQHENDVKTVIAHLDSIEAGGLELSDRVSDGIDGLLFKEQIDFGDLKDDGEKLFRLQKENFSDLLMALRLNSCSGVFYILDTAVNSSLPEGELSRSGMYLRLANVYTQRQRDPQIVCFRGIADVARQEKLQLHNRWELEFSLANLPRHGDYFGAQKKDISSVGSGFWSERIRIPDTWEDALYFFTPLVGNQEVYGLAGIEVSQLYFSHINTAKESEFGPVITLLAPLEENRLQLSGGLLSSFSGDYLDSEEELIVTYRKGYNFYKGRYEDYVGLQRLLPVSSDRQWFLLTLVPKRGYDSFIFTRRRIWFFSAILFFLLLCIVSYFVSARLAMPLSRTLHDIKKGEVSSQDYGFKELNDLMGLIEERKKNAKHPSSPAAEPYLLEFALKLQRLPAKERLIFHYIAEGFSDKEIEEKVFISRATLEEYYKIILEKLDLTSKRELHLYLFLFQAYNRMEDIRII